jgi:hypothetical protein
MDICTKNVRRMLFPQNASWMLVPMYVYEMDVSVAEYEIDVVPLMDARNSRQRVAPIGK